MIPHFTLRQNKGEYLIIRMGDVFHIIDCNEALTKDKRLAILESGCTPAQMQEMGLSGMTIPKSDIKALTVTGCGFQDDVIFYLSKKKLAFWFPKAYEQQKVDDFFRGIPRKQVKTRRRPKGGKNLSWREREGNPEVARKLRPVGWVMNTIGVGLLVFPLVIRIPLGMHGGLVLGFCAAAVFLDMFFPEYFSLLMEGKKERKEREGRWVNLSFGLFLSIIPLALRITVTIHLFDVFRFLPMALGMTLITGAVLFLFCREFREEWGIGLCMLFFVLVMSWLAFAPWLNHVLGPELTPVTATIVEQHKSGGRTTSYYCGVLLPDGRELDVEVSRSEYHDYEIGDTMDLQIGTGFFGIDYAIDG